MEDLITLVENYIEKHGLLAGNRLVVGVSGGADSMALLFVLKKIRDKNSPDLPMLCAHVHHGIRKEADADEKMVRDFSEKLKIPFFSRHVDIPKIAENLGRFGIKEFTISSNFSGLIETLAEFEKNGFKMNGLTTVNAGYRDWATGELKKLPAIRMTAE